MTGTPWKFRGIGIVAVAVFVFLYLPIVTLVVLSFSNGDSAAGGLQHGMSLRWYRALLTDEEIQRVLRNSLTVGAISTVLATIIATMAALGLSQGHFPGQRKVEGAVMVPLVIPEIVLGVALLLLFVAAGMPLGITTISIAHIVLILPVAYVPIRARLQGLDPALFEAASDLYASPSLVFRRITLPLIAPGIAAGALLAFIGSFSDVVVSYFVAGPGSTTLPVYALSMVRVGVTPLINAVSTLLLAAPTAILIIAHFFNRSQEKRMEALA
jgi:spermidine/putrescine transport system permease protein